MAAFILDASVALSWCFPGDPTENTDYSRAILERMEESDAFVPEIWPFEIANGIFVACNKRRRINEADSQEYKVLRGGWLWNIALQALARKHNLCKAARTEGVALI
jgi:hypothetical protein